MRHNHRTGSEVSENTIYRGLARSSKRTTFYERGSFALHGRMFRDGGTVASLDVATASKSTAQAGLSD